MKNLSVYALAVLLLVGINISCDNEKDNSTKSQEIDNHYKFDDKIPVVNETVAIELKKGKMGLWDQLMPPTMKVEGAYVSSIDNLIVVAGGYPYTSMVQIYNIETATWYFGASLPFGSHNCEGAGVAKGGLLYCVGGRDIGNAFWAYDPVLDTWDVSLPALPTPRGGLAVASVGNYIYAMGGRLGGSPRNGTPMEVVERYNITQGIWETVAQLPSARMDLAAAAVGGKIYVFGGFDSNRQAMNDVDVYDPNTDTWDTSPADLPTARAGLYAVGIKGGTVYVIGGQQGGIFNTAPGSVGTIVEAYNVAKDEWLGSDNFNYMPSARGEAGVANHGGAIYMVGGAEPSGGTYYKINFMEVFYPSKK